MPTYLAQVAVGANRISMLFIMRYGGMETIHPLRLWRQTKKLRLSDVCKTLSIQKGYLSELERGLKVPSLALAERIRNMTKNRVQAKHFAAMQH